MNSFNNQMFNPSYVNPTYYKSCRPTLDTMSDDIKITKAVHAVHDLCDAVKDMDEDCQQTAFCACLAQMATDFNWK